MASQLAAAAILAHQGGWDEMLMVAAPIVVFALILRVANKRAERRAAELATKPPADAEPSLQPGDVRPE
jgi:hypothetical protein